MPLDVGTLHYNAFSDNFLQIYNIHICCRSRLPPFFCWMFSENHKHFLLSLLTLEREFIYNLSLWWFEIYSVCKSVGLSVCMSLCQSVCLSVSQLIFLSVFLSALISTIGHQQANMQWSMCLMFMRKGLDTKIYIVTWSSIYLIKAPKQTLRSLLTSNMQNIASISMLKTSCTISCTSLADTRKLWQAP